LHSGKVNVWVSAGVLAEEKSTTMLWSATAAVPTRLNCPEVSEVTDPDAPEVTVPSEVL